MMINREPGKPLLAAVIMADIRGYTDYTQRHGDDAARILVSRFQERAREALGEIPFVIQFHAGDAMLALFPSAGDALRASVALRRRWQADDAAGGRIPVGLGLSCGDVTEVHGDYEGLPLIIASRLCGMAEAGVALAEERVVEAAGEAEGVRSVVRGPLSLKGVTSPVTAYVVVGKDEPADGSPLYRVLAKLAAFQEENERQMLHGIQNHWFALGPLFDIDPDTGRSEEQIIVEGALGEALAKGYAEQLYGQSLRLTFLGWKFVRGRVPGSERDEEVLATLVAAWRDPGVPKIQDRWLSMQTVFNHFNLDWDVAAASNAAHRLEEAGLLSVRTVIGGIRVAPTGPALQNHSPS